MYISSRLMTTLVVITLISLPILLILPFGIVGGSSNRKNGIIQGVLKPGHYRYTLSIPERYDGENSVPLVLVLHYGGHGTPYYGKFFLTETVLPALQEIAAIFVAPDCPSSDWTQPESEKMILDLLDHVVREYQIDQSRILIVGYSMGGVGAWHWVQKSPGRFKAALIMAAAPPDEFDALEDPVSVYVIHGRDDELFPVVNTNRAVVQLENLGVDVKYRILEKTGHYETHRYLTPMSDAIPWIMGVWNEEKKT